VNAPMVPSDRICSSCSFYGALPGNLPRRGSSSGRRQIGTNDDRIAQQEARYRFGSCL
jgi:hypothetical protein